MAEATARSGADRPKPGRKRSLREQEAELNARASLLDTTTDIGFRESFGIIMRGWSYMRYFWGRYLVKFTLSLFALAIPVVILPWPVKIIVDHVVLSRPIEEASGYPFFMMPIVTALHGLTPIEILVWLTALAAVMVVLIGAYAPGGEHNDRTDPRMEDGHDVATAQDNWLHQGHSFASGLWGFFEFKIHTRLTQSLNHLLRAQLFEHIKSLPMTTLDDQRIGDSVYRVMYDAPSVTEVFYEVLNTPLLSITTFGFGALTLLSAYPDSTEIVWFAFALVPVYVLLTTPFARMLRRRAQASRSAGTIATSTIEEGMDNMLAVQSLGGDTKERMRFGDDSKDAFRRYRYERLIFLIINHTGGFGVILVYVAAIVYVTGKVIEGTMSPGDYGALLFYFGWMRGPATSISMVWLKLQNNVTGLRRVFALMDLPKEEDLGTRDLPPIRQGVTFNRAGLVYPDGRRALGDVTFEAHIGQIVALVGPTGAGKTSLAYLIPRYHVATEGEVLVDGQDVTDATAASLRSQITYVFQETQLFSDSIADNIRFGKPDASDAEVERVARIAGVHDFITSLPDGYATKLGTTSSKLSVGQKQRIAIARGLIRDSRILILDEPTSALDPETEEYLVQSLHEAARDRLVIIIAHRLSTIAHADKIVFLEDGHVREQGTHAELVARSDGYYRRFVDLQTSSA